MMLDLRVLAGLGVAFGCGLLIGIERERRKGIGAHRGYAGVRSFTLAAVIGALADALGGKLVFAGGALIVLLSVIAYWRDRSDDPGITNARLALARGLGQVIANGLHVMGVTPVEEMH